ncbi:MAG: hypothetical protein ACOH5I_03290 [Oligoflexus sp.]
MTRFRQSSLCLAGLMAVFLSVIGACTHSNNEQLGLQIDNLAYIPARIAVLPCRLWPEQASYREMPLSNIPEDNRRELCQNLDQFVVEGFKNQPYMRGISPSVVLALLEREEKLDILDRIDELWRRQPSDCSNCTNAVSYYKQAISERESWRLWLSEFSRAAFNSDAILIPFITYAHEGRTEERGLSVAYRNGGTILLLIDTNTGALIWAGGREAQARRQLPKTQAGPESPEYPAWSELVNRLLIDEIWQQFPGRQNY